jgi:hypothetical protein
VLLRLNGCTERRMRWAESEAVATKTRGAKTMSIMECMSSRCCLLPPSITARAVSQSASSPAGHSRMWSATGERNRSRSLAPSAHEMSTSRCHDPSRLLASIDHQRVLSLTGCALVNTPGASRAAPL